MVAHRAGTCGPAEAGPSADYFFTQNSARAAITANGRRVKLFASPAFLVSLGIAEQRS